MTTKKAPNIKAAKPLRPKAAAKTESKKLDLSASFVKFLLADEFRPELNTGKVQAIGLYPDSTLVVNLPRAVSEPSRETPVGIDSLGMLFTVGGFVGVCDVQISINEKEVATTRVELEHGKSTNVLIQSKPFLIASFGIKTVSVVVGDKVFNFTFEVRRGDVIDVPQVNPGHLVA